MTQPVSVAAEHSGRAWKVAPTSFPAGTVTFPPARMAETTRRRKAGLGSICVASSRMSMAAPWEWPMKMTGRPRLSWAR